MKRLWSGEETLLPSIALARISGREGEAPQVLLVEGAT